MKVFECKMCGNCCNGERILSLSKEEIKRISIFLKVTEAELKTKYCIKIKNNFEIRSKNNHCIFLEKKNGYKICNIHPVKPDICKLWPFLPAIISDENEWKIAMDFCPGINPHCSFEEFVKEAKKSGLLYNIKSFKSNC